MSNEKREQQMMDAAERYAEEVNATFTGNDEEKHQERLVTMNDFAAGWQEADNSRWIPVEEQLPEKDNEFEDYSKLVIVTNGKDFWKGMYNYGGEEWLTFDLWEIDDATHWMEFVPPRKED